MVSAKACHFIHADGRVCRAPPLKERRLCYWHDPATKEDAVAAAKLGGARRRKDQAVAAAYDIAGVRSLHDVRRILDIMLIDALSLENSPARGRLLNAGANTALKLLELVRFEEDEEA